MADAASRPDRAPAGAFSSADGDSGEDRLPYGKQPCLQCGFLISDIAGSKAAVCARCGFKDPCC